VTHRRRTRLSSHSSPGSNPLDNDPTYSSSLSPMTIRSSLFPPDILGVLVPFLYASGYALIFTSLLVLPTEDDSSDSKALGEQHSQFASHQRRQVSWSANRPCVRTRATMCILPSQRTLWVRSPASVTVTTHIKPPAAQVPPKGYLVRIDCSSPLFLNVSMCSSTVHLADTRPHSPPTSPSPTQAPSAAPTPPMVKLIVH